jgi:ribosomal protein S18 acetylase RimI-like enzyme
MNFVVKECGPNDDVWRGIAGLFPRAVGWSEDPDDTGSYHFFAATDDAGRFLGGSVIDIGPMGLGPLAETTIGFLEDIEVLEAHRRKGVDKALLRAALRLAWERGAMNVRWSVDYENAAGIALYASMGFAFVPEEDPDARHPQKCYTVVAANPEPR